MFGFRRSYSSRRGGYGLLGMAALYGWRNRSRIQSFLSNYKNRRGSGTVSDVPSGTVNDTNRITPSSASGAESPVRDDLLKTG